MFIFSLIIASVINVFIIGLLVFIEDKCFDDEFVNKLQLSQFIKTRH